VNSAPQRLKPRLIYGICGTTEVVPFPEPYTLTHLPTDRVRPADIRDPALSLPKARLSTFTSPAIAILLHIKQAQAREAVFLQQALVDVLLLQLLDLCTGHLAAVGSEVAVGFGANGNDLVV